MSDTRFTILGIILIFAGFILVGTVGSQFNEFTIQVNEFGDCYDYTDDGKAIPIDCEIKMQDRTILFGGTIALVGGGIVLLVKGVRGKWDQDVKSDEMVGPKKDPRDS